MHDEQLVRDARSIFQSALRECSIAKAIRRKLRVESHRSEVLLFAGDATIRLDGLRDLRVVACGKAASAMLDGVLTKLVLPQQVAVRGVLIAPERPQQIPPGFAFYAGGHPLPNQASFDGARAVLQMVGEAANLQEGLCLFLISGGASAMMELPLAPEVSLEDTAAFYRALVRCGATITEINCIRKHFSAVKGGRLARAAGRTPKLTVLVSDVPPRHLDALASGPTLTDPTTVKECRDLVAKYSLGSMVPESVRRYLDGAIEETPKPGELDSQYCVLLDSTDLSTAAQHAAEGLGYKVVVDDTCDDWPYAEAAAYLLQRLEELRAQYGRVCLLSAGEVTVAVPRQLSGASHRGGRNQHFALYAAARLAQSASAAVVLSGGSDGIDGESPAAGAVISSRSLEAAAEQARAQAALEAFDSYPFLEARGDTLVTGPTGNNLRDLRILLCEV